MSFGSTSFSPVTTLAIYSFLFRPASHSCHKATDARVSQVPLRELYIANRSSAFFLSCSLSLSLSQHLCLSDSLGVHSCGCSRTRKKSAMPSHVSFVPFSYIQINIIAVARLMLLTKKHAYVDRTLCRYLLRERLCTFPDLWRLLHKCYQLLSSDLCRHICDMRAYTP